MDSDRKRSSNFSCAEESLLVNLVEKYKHILENKKSDTDANFKKTACWKSIEKQFNNLSGVSYRDAKVLKKKYDNLKKRTKKKFSDEKCYKMGTGGGPSKDIYITDIDTKIKEILGCRVEGLVSEFGDDACDIETQATESGNSGVLAHDYFEVPVEEISDNNDQVQEIVEIEDNASMMLEKGGQSDWSNYTPSMLRTPVSRPLSVKKNGTPKKSEENFGTRICQWADAKSALESERKRFLLEEHTQKLQCFKEKHEEELRLMKEEANFRMRLAKEEHNKRMEILELEKKKILINAKK